MYDTEDFLSLIGRHKKIINYLFQNRGREVSLDEVYDISDQKSIQKLKKASIVITSDNSIELAFLITQFLESFFTGIGYSGIDSVKTNLEEIEAILDRIKLVTNEQKEIKKLRTLMSRIFIDVKEFLKKINYEISETYKSADSFEIKKEQLLKSKEDLDKVAKTADTLRAFIKNNKARVLMLSSDFLHSSIKEMGTELAEMPLKIRFSNGELYRWINDMEARIEKNEKILILAKMVENHRIETVVDQIDLDLLEKPITIKGCFPQEESNSEKFIKTYAKITKISEKRDKEIFIDDFPEIETLHIPDPMKLHEKFLATSDNLSLISFLAQEIESNEQVLEMFCEMISLFSDHYHLSDQKEIFKNWEVSKILKKEQL